MFPFDDVIMKTQARRRRVLLIRDRPPVWAIDLISDNGDTARTVPTELCKALSMGTVLIPANDILMSSPSRHSYITCLHA